MYNITIIFTRHDELGKCNSNELYEIFERLSPDVIFEELPPNSFNEFYINKTRRNLETDTITRYIELHKIPHTLVDSDDIPSEKFFSDRARLFGKIEGSIDENGFALRNSIDVNKANSYMLGFEYLNSIQCQELYDNVSNAIENGVNKLNEERFFKIQELSNKWIDMRENQMLQNIYEYSKKNSFNKAVFTIGAAHSKSLMSKILDHEKREDLKLNWSYYGTSAST